MNIRRATLADLDALVPLFDAYRQFYRQPPDPVRAGRFLRERMSRNESVVFLAETDGAPVGFVQLYAAFWSIAACRAWILNDLFVEPGHRRNGAGRALLERAQQHALDTGAGGLSLATERTNLAAQKLYDSLGWRQDQEFVHYELPLRT